MSVATCYQRIAIKPSNAMRSSLFGLVMNVQSL
jgi:hypothetical protein